MRLVIVGEPAPDVPFNRWVGRDWGFKGPCERGFQGGAHPYFKPW